MITADNYFVIRAGDKQQFAATIKNTLKIDVDLNFIIDILVYGTDAVEGQILGGCNIVTDAPHLDAFTPSGSTLGEQIANQVDLYVKDYLEGITSNSAVTFTIT